MASRRVVVTIADGLHARPAAVFVRLASEQRAAVTVRRPDGPAVPATSILGVMTLDVRPGDEVILEADGPRAETAVAALAGWLTGMLTVRAPLAGVVTPLTKLPDPVFSTAMVGPGLAIQPDDEGVHGATDARAPIDGVVTTIHPHAFVVTAADGRGVLVHLGLDTVRLEGQGFTVHAAPGQEVRAGDVVVTWHPDTVRAAGHPTVCPVIALDAHASAVAPVAAAGDAIRAGSALLSWQ